MATYRPPFGQSTIQQQIVKLDILGEDLALGVSGPVGLQQGFSAEIASTIKKTGNRANWRSVSKAREALTKDMWKHAGAAWDRAGTVAGSVPAAAQECLTHSLVAYPVYDEAHLIQFNPQCDPEEATV
jgi:hypothetical protein